jgi:hypothetical protein
MGLELLLPLLAPFLKYIIGAVAIIVALAAAYFGIKRRGAAEERDRHFKATYQAQQETQRKLDDSRSKDAEIDQATRDKVATIKRKADAGAGPSKPDRFRFCWVLVAIAAGLIACATPIAAPPGVRVDVPSRPILPDCPELPLVEGALSRDDEGAAIVIIPFEQAKLLHRYMREYRGCAETREVLLDGWADKLSNRLRAIGGP